MGAGFDAMGRRTGEQLGESLRELAQAQLDDAEREQPERRRADRRAAPDSPPAPH